MCGVHSVDGSPIGHDHADGHHHGDPAASGNKIFRPRPRHRSRRAFLGDFGKGTMAMAIFTLTACSSDDSPSASADPTVTPNPTAAPDPTAAPATSNDDGSTGDGDEPAAQPDALPEARWGRATLGSVSAYVLARGNTAAIVDTGNPGSAQAIGETLGEMGLTYGDVQHLILTHNHRDHAGSTGEVVALADAAAVYAGEADANGIGVDNVVGLVGGEDVFGFEMLATPGHTPGHMCVIDHQTGVLVAGDALFAQEGGVVEGPERFYDDLEQSRDTIRLLASLSFDTLLVGHGEPIEGNADTAVADLAASLPS